VIRKLPVPKEDPAHPLAGRVPLTKKGRDRVASLKRAAADLFVERGFEATTMTEIAERAGASIGSLYQYFPTRNHLAEALYEDGLASLLDSLHLARASGGTAPDVAVRLFEALSDPAAANPAFREIASRRGADPTVQTGARNRICATVADALARATPPLSPSRSMVSAILIVHLADAASARLPSAPRGDLMREEIRRMLRLYLANPV
jgi:AcrR family transcriptional regulator